MVELGADLINCVPLYSVQGTPFADIPSPTDIETGSIRDLKGCIPKLDHTVTIEEMNQAVLDHAAELDAATRSDAYQNSVDGEAA